MLKLFKESFKTANDCIILAIPLVLFIWIISFYIGYANRYVDVPAELIIAIITTLIMAGIFFSGWIYMLKKGIDVSKGVYVLDQDRLKAVRNLFRLMPHGIGKFFLSFIGMFLLFKVYAVVTYFAINLIGTHLIGAVYTADQASNVLSSTPQELITLLSSLSPEQLTKLRLWNVLIFLTTTVFLFSIMLWVPEIIYSTPNPFKALIIGAKKAFQKFRKSACLFAFLTLLNIIVSLISTFALMNPILYILIMVIMFYYIIYSIVLVFSFYRQEFCETEVTNET